MRRKTPSPDVNRPCFNGCFAISLVWAIVFGIAAVAFRSVYLGIPALLALPMLFYAAIELDHRRALIRMRKRGIQGLLLYSDSPHWKQYIETAWIPVIGDRLVVLNWSQRKNWQSSLEVSLFRWYCGTQENFNPAIVLGRGLRAPLVFRFFYAFRDAKHGNLHALEKLERRLFQELNVAYSGCSYEPAAR